MFHQSYNFPRSSSERLLSINAPTSAHAACCSVIMQGWSSNIIPLPPRKTSHCNSASTTACRSADRLLSSVLRVLAQPTNTIILNPSEHHNVDIWNNILLLHEIQHAVLHHHILNNSLHAQNYANEVVSTFQTLLLRHQRRVNFFTLLRALSAQSRKPSSYSLTDRPT